MTKYVYVLTIDETDYYLEQALLSITLLRIHMPNAFVSLLVDDVTGKTLGETTRKNILTLVNEIKVVEIDCQFDKKARSRWLKTSMRKHIEGNFLYIDCDTIICDNLSDIEKMNVDLGAVWDMHTRFQDNHNKRTIQGRYETAGFDSPFISNEYFNSGVIFCKNIPVCYDFFGEWHRLWLHSFNNGLMVDMPSLNQANCSMNNVIVELGGEWNCQISDKGAVNYLHSSKIIHYFNVYKYESPYRLANKDIIKNIKKTGSVNLEVKNMLLHPKSHFSSDTRLVNMDDATQKYFKNFRNEFNKSESYNIAKHIYNSKFHFVFEYVVPFIIKKILKPVRKCIKKYT